MIVVDLDGVVFDSTTPLQRHACAVLGLDAGEYVRPPERYDIFDHFPEAHKPALARLKRRAFDECDPDVYAEAEPIRAVSELLGEIDRYYRLSAYLTARPPRAAVTTQRRLAEIGAPDAPVIHTRDKAAACYRLYTRYAIEDNYEYAQQMARLGVRVFLIDLPYNQGHPYPHITRVTPTTLMTALWEAHHGVGAGR